MQWVDVGLALVLATKLSGQHVLLSVTAPCFFTNATGIVTLLAALARDEVDPALVLAVRDVGALIVIGKVDRGALVDA